MMTRPPDSVTGKHLPQNAPTDRARHPITWVVVVSAGTAVVYAVDARRTRATREFQLVHRDGRVKARDVDSDRPGRTHDRFGHARHAYDVSERQSRERRLEFSRRIARRLEQGLRDRAYDRLVLIAPPASLGTLRSILPAPLRERVVHEAARDLPRIDLTRADADALREIVPGAIDATEGS